MRYLLAFILVFPVLASAAKVYSWTDSSGQRHYSSSPPPNIKASTSESKSSAKPAGAAVQTSPPALAAPAAASGETPAQTAKRRAADCASAQQQISLLSNTPAHRLQIPKADGSTERMTDEVHAQRLSAAQQAASNNCGK